jgi:pilus assembly protein CpaF
MFKSFQASPHHITGSAEAPVKEAPSSAVSEVPEQAAPLQVSERVAFWLKLKQRLHHMVLESMDLSQIEKVGRAELRHEIGALCARELQVNGPHLGADRFKTLVTELLDEVLGLGPLEPLLQDETISDILVNGPDNIYIERHGLLEKSDAQFMDERHLLRVIDKIVSGVGRRIDESQPWVDARLEDGSRVNAVIRPCAIDGPSLSIRKFSEDKLTLDKLVGFGALNKEAAIFLEAVVKSRINVLISGGTGSGKTTMLNAMSSFIDPRQRIVTIEDAAELQLQQDHVVRLETRPSNVEGTGEISQRELVKNALRMRPDRIIIGEVRGNEAFDMLQAMNTGHDGSMTTIHANTARDSISRLEQMVIMVAMIFRCPLCASKCQPASRSSSS